MTQHTATCPNCGYTTTSKTAPLAARGIRLHSCDKQRAKDASRARRLARAAAVDKTPKPCHHRQTTHQHGTHPCYVLDSCRCTPCTAANTAYERQRSRQHAYGRFDHKWVDAQPVRDHVLALGRAGLGLKKVVALTGYSQGAMTKLIYGSDGRQPTRRILRTHADAILAVKADLTTLADGARLDGTGTRRRLQALMALGWSQSKLARALGYELRNFCYLIHGKREVTAKNARNVASLYEQLWDQQPPRQGRGDKGAYTRSLRYAREHGWAVPMAWDESTIDDPAATPDLGDDRARNGGRPSEYVIEDIEFLLRHDPMLTARQLADRLHVTRQAIQDACRRAERWDLLDQLGRNADLARPGQANRKDKAA